MNFRFDRRVVYSVQAVFVAPGRWKVMGVTGVSGSRLEENICVVDMLSSSTASEPSGQLVNASSHVIWCLLRPSGICLQSILIITSVLLLYQV
jgi:hypothetical protein